MIHTKSFIYEKRYIFRWKIRKRKVKFCVVVVYNIYVCMYNIQENDIEKFYTLYMNNLWIQGHWEKLFTHVFCLVVFFLFFLIKFIDFV